MIDHLMIFLCWFRSFFISWFFPAGPEWWRAGWCQPGAGFIIERGVKLIQLTEFHVIHFHEPGNPEVRFQRQAELQRRSREGEETWSADKGSSTGISWCFVLLCFIVLFANLISKWQILPRLKHSLKKWRVMAKSLFSHGTHGLRVRSSKASWPFQCWPPLRQIAAVSSTKVRSQTTGGRPGGLGGLGFCS